MSKQGTETAEQTRREKERPRKREKIPDVEWLFANDGKKKADSSSGFLGKLMRRDWWKLVYTTLIYLLQALPTWLLPLVTNDVIDLLVDRPEGYIVRLIVDAAVLLVVVLQNVPTTMWRSNILYAWERRLTAQIKAGVIRKLQRLSITYHKEMEEGRIQSKFLRDIDSVAGYTRSFLFVTLPAIVGVIVSTVIALYKSPIVTLFFIVIIPLNVLLTLAFRKRIRKDNYVYRKENEGLSSKITTTLQMLTLSKAHGLNFVEEVAVGQKINSVTEAGIKLDRTVASFGSMMWVTGQLLSAVCLFFCVFLAINGTITAGEVILFQSLFSSISGSVLTLINSYPALMAGKEAVRSLSEIINASEIEPELLRSARPSV